MNTRLQRRGRSVFTPDSLFADRDGYRRSATNRLQDRVRGYAEIPAGIVKRRTWRFQSGWKTLSRPIPAQLGTDAGGRVRGR